MPMQQARHFLQIPGPTNVPDRILRAMDRPTIDHRSAEFGQLGRDCIAGMKTVLQTEQHVVIYPASGTGAWEAALVNTLSPGDKVLMFETGHFATMWQRMAGNLGLDVELEPGDWRQGVDPERVEARLAEDKSHAIKAVAVMHNETSTGVTSRIADIRRAIDRAGHPALFMVDTISSLASMDYRQDEWGVDVTVAGSQKGLMLPPGLSFNGFSDKALAASKRARLPKSYWDWADMLAVNHTGHFPYTPATNMLFGLREAIAMLLEEGLPNVFERHRRFGEATRRAVRAWGLEVLSREPAEYSSTLTTVMMPPGCSEVRLRQLILEHYNMSLGAGLGKLKDKVVRIGHLGDFNDLMLCGTLCGIEMGLTLANVPHRSGGVQAAMAYLSTPEITAPKQVRASAGGN